MIHYLKKEAVLSHWKRSLLLTCTFCLALAGCAGNGDTSNVETMDTSNTETIDISDEREDDGSKPSGTVTMPRSATDYIGMRVSQVDEEIQRLGFWNGDADAHQVCNNEKGPEYEFTVTEVSIGGNSSFEAGQELPRDGKIIIKYYGYYEES